MIEDGRVHGPDRFGRFGLLLFHFEISFLLLTMIGIP